MIKLDYFVEDVLLLTKANGEKVFPMFEDLRAEQAPKDWSDYANEAEHGTLVGVLDFESEHPPSSFYLSRQGIAEFRNRSAQLWIPYKDIQGWGPFSKNPLPTCFPLWTSDGRRMSIPLKGEEALAFLRYVCQAREVVLRALRNA